MPAAHAYAQLRCLSHATTGMANSRLPAIPDAWRTHGTPVFRTLCHAILNCERNLDREVLKHCSSSPVYKQVLLKTGIDNPTAKPLQRQYDQRPINSCLRKALNCFEKEARRYKITREGQVNESTFPVGKPPTRYPDILAVHCEWRTHNIKRVVQVDSGLMVHTRQVEEPSYPHVESLHPALEAHKYQVVKPWGMYFALGSMWLDWQNDLLWEYEVGRLPKRGWKPGPPTEPFEVVTLSVSPDKFTWAVNASAPTDKVLVIDCKEQFDAVQQVFPMYGKFPDWGRLSKVYAGVDVRIGKHSFESLDTAPGYVFAWDIIGPCIWDLAAVEAELEVRTCKRWQAAHAWIKAQEATASSTHLLLDREDN